jgi:tetratricopeptide (TPR) repeat protein
MSVNELNLEQQLELRKILAAQDAESRNKAVTSMTAKRKTTENIKVVSKGENNILSDSKNRNAQVRETVEQSLSMYDYIGKSDGTGNTVSGHEAVKLIQTMTKQNKEIKEAKELAKLLRYFPLALAQASAYIAHNNTSISDYLILYKKYEKELLADSTLPKGDNHLPVATTCNITLEALARDAKDKQQPLVALELLQVCAYLDPDKIPRALLLTWLKECHAEISNPELVIDDYIRQLGQYSLIYFDGNADIGIHRLVQAVLRHQHQSTKQSALTTLSSKWYNSLLKAANSEFVRKTNVLEDESRQKKLLPHMKALLHHNYVKQQKPSVQLSNLLDNIGRVFLRQLDNPKKASRYFLQSLYLDELLYGKHQINVAIVLNNLGNAFGYLGNTKQQKILLERALIIKEQHFGKGHSQVASTLHNIGNAFGDLGNTKQQKELLERALTIQEQYLGKEHPELAITLHNFGIAFGSLGDHKQKKVLLERALIIKEQHFGKEHPQFAITLHSLGNAFGYLGNIKQQKILLERALTILEQHFGKEHPEVAITLNSLGNALGELGDAKQSKELLERALTILEQHFGKVHPEVALTLYNLAITNETFNNIEVAYTLAERSYQIYLKTFDKEHPDTQDADKLRIRYKSLLPNPTASATTISARAPIVHRYTQQQSSPQPEASNSSIPNPNSNLNLQDTKKGAL